MIDFLQIGVPALNKLMIQMEGIVKRFGSITALDNMNFHAYGGEITAIVGDNGSDCRQNGSWCDAPGTILNFI